MPRQADLTIDRLAAQLGVHKSSVSRAMDPARRHMISAELLARVEQAAQELGYRPNRAAAALSTGRSRTIGVLLPDITNPVFPPILRGIEDALDAEGYFALLANTSRHEAAAQQAVERMQQQRVEGFVIATAVRDDTWLEGLRKSGAPIVLVNRSDGRGLLPAVLSDDAVGMRLVAEHLLGLGHRRIVHLAGPQGLSTGLARQQGLVQALADQGRQLVATQPCEAYSVAAGAAAMQALLGTPTRARRARPARLPFTAVVAGNDLIALGALQVLRTAGIAVPGEVSLVGHNDMPLLDQISPPLTTVRIQHYEMGHRAARLLLESLQGAPGSGSSTLLLRPSLVVRGSTSTPVQP